MLVDRVERNAEKLQKNPGLWLTHMGRSYGKMQHIKLWS